jgi:branched-chain amino acid transport system ATP-binding protein
MPPALELTDVEAGYGDMPALFGVDMVVPTGSVTAVLGPNGAGKSTSLRVVAGIMKPWGGSVRLNGRDVTGRSVRALARDGLCLVLEGRGIFPTLTVRENLLVQTHLRGRGTAGQIEEIAYGRFPVLRQRRNQLAGTMSGGEQQMLALSRVLTTNPSVILLDEISMGLAPKVVEELFGVVRQLAADGMTVLLVEQLAQGALGIADYVYVLNHGKVRSVGQPADVRDTIARSYLGGTVNDHDQSLLADVGSLSETSRARVVTPSGTLSHKPSCVVVWSVGSARPLLDGEVLGECALCGSHGAA